MVLRHRSGQALALSGVFLLATARPLAAQDASERSRLDAIARVAAQQFAEARLDQTRPTAPAPPPGMEIRLTLDEATARALERNLDIAVERLNPQAFDFSIAALEATYRPTFASNLGMRSQSQFPRSQTAGADMLVTDTLTGNTGLLQNVKRGGGSVSVNFNNNRLSQTDQFVTRNPALNTNLTANYVQPLLRNFRIDGTRAQLQITVLNQEVSEITLRARIVTTLANVRNAYWDLIYSIEAADVAERSLALAAKLVEDNRARVEIGTMAPLDVVQAQAEEAIRRQAVTQTAAARRTAELVLKRLIVDGTDDPFWLATISPVDRPTYSTEPLDVAAAVRGALQNRTDLQESQRQLASNDISLRSLSDQQLPALDLTASYGLAGVGGPQFIRQGSGLGSTIINTIPGGFTNALGILTDRTAPTWSLAVNFSYPIGASPAQANLARARLQQRQTIAQGRQLELQIATEVTNAALLVESNREGLQAAVAARELAEKRLEAEQSRFDVGLSTNFFVVQAQRDLRDAQNGELRALLDYRRAQVDFDRVQEVPTGGGGGITAINAGGGGTAPRAGGGGQFGGGGGN
ncbi:MAG: type secretion outer rane protein, TolC family [Acidobacteria bacterium]|nr:type secretion outer rane protein, TolC family [Acidobacteriota bacterium]